VWDTLTPYYKCLDKKCIGTHYEQLRQSDAKTKSNEMTSARTSVDFAQI